jgi:hypothetical protein
MADIRDALRENAQDRLGGMRRLSLAAQVILVSAAIAAALAAVLRQDRSLAACFVSENGPVEALQGLMLAIAALMCALRCRRLVAAGRPAVSEVVLTYGFVVLLTGELDVWKTLVGRNLTIRRILLLPPAPFIRAMLILAVMVAVSVGVAVYALRHLRELWHWELAALETGWGRLLLLGVLIFAGTELFERRLNWILPAVFPKTFLEEGLELFANAFFLLALRARERADPATYRPDPTTTGSSAT